MQDIQDSKENITDSETSEPTEETITSINIKETNSIPAEEEKIESISNTKNSSIQEETKNNNFLLLKEAASNEKDDVPIKLDFLKRLEKKTEAILSRQMLILISLIVLVGLQVIFILCEYDKKSFNVFKLSLFFKVYYKVEEHSRDCAILPVCSILHLKWL